MTPAPRTKLFYPVDEACARLGLSLLDLSVLVAEGRITLSTAVPGLQVEEGRYKTEPDGTRRWVSEGVVYLRGLVDLCPEDAWHALRYGSHTLRQLADRDGCHRFIVPQHERDCGHSILREEIGLRHEVLVRQIALAAECNEVAPPRGSTQRGAQPHYDWDAARLEAFRRIYFEGVPESYGALIRHLQAWFANRGGRVPDESTLKRRLRDIWATFGPEAQQPAA